MEAELEIAPRFCGPPGTANGGYLAGRLAAGMAGPVEVSLRAPTPLATKLEVVLHDDGSRSLQREGVELARARSAALALELRAPPDPSATAASSGSCRAMRTHPFPECFVCGPARASGDGLRIFPGLVANSDAVAALWTPDASLCDASGCVAPEFLWAALDSPSAFPLLEPESARALEPMVLGRICVALDGELRADETALLLAWPLAREGRRGIAAAALFRADGSVIARARATWASLAGRA
ncbi:MAG TPA: hypothetical protein VEI82_09480 [Myxococcota bacterium]|nr:hypothetical protein [Myxococcota bacterium]